MLRAVSLTILTLVSAPFPAAQAPDETVLAQQQQQPPQTQKRDCERKQDEGVS